MFQLCVCFLIFRFVYFSPKCSTSMCVSPKCSDFSNFLPIVRLLCLSSKCSNFFVCISQMFRLLFVCLPSVLNSMFVFPKCSNFYVCVSKCSDFGVYLSNVPKSIFAFQVFRHLWLFLSGVQTSVLCLLSILTSTFVFPK